MAQPVQFVGTLNQNRVLQTLYNMIISQMVFSENIKLKGTLFDMFRVDGTLYGDTKLFISTDVGTVYNFPDTNKNLLSKNPPADPTVQAVTIDTFKQTALTVDGVLLKQAFMSADIYGAFVSVMLQWLHDTYKVLNVTMINAYVGTVETNATKNKYTTPALDGNDSDTYEIFGKKIGETVANVLTDLQDVSRDFNDVAFLRSYTPSDFVIVWNSKFLNAVKYMSLPTIFHKNMITNFDDIKQVVINHRYFGVPVTNGGTTDAADTHRFLKDTVVAGAQYFGGDYVPSGYTYVAGEVYTETGEPQDDESIVCKIVHKKAIPFMSALKIQTEFYNPKDLDRNYYLTWGYSDPVYLAEYPIISIVTDKA